MFRCNNHFNSDYSNSSVPLFLSCLQLWTWFWFWTIKPAARAPSRFSANHLLTCSITSLHVPFVVSPFSRRRIKTESCRLLLSGGAGTAQLQEEPRADGPGPDRDRDRDPDPECGAAWSGKRGDSWCGGVYRCDRNIWLIWSNTFLNVNISEAVQVEEPV